MATSDTSERKATKSSPVGAPPPEPEHLPCPRCDSTNTKFCYYNNYNFSQPRHFCKACRRYWTHGGTLRDIPIGGGSRKNAKRSRTAIAAAATTTSSGSTTEAVFSSAHHHDFRHLPAGASQLLVPDHGGTPVPFITDGKMSMSGSFTSLLNMNNTHHQGTGVVALGGFGLVGLEDVGFGLGRGTVWPFTTSGQYGGGSSVAGHTWQLENGENGFGTGSGDCFALPDLAISTRGSTVLK